MKTARPQRTVYPQLRTPRCSAANWRRVPFADEGSFANQCGEASRMNKFDEPSQIASASFFKMKFCGGEMIAW